MNEEQSEQVQYSVPLARMWVPGGYYSVENLVELVKLVEAMQKQAEEKK